MAFDWLWARGFPLVFWQSGHDLGVFSTVTESGGFTGFPGTGFGKRSPYRAYLGPTHGGFVGSFHDISNFPEGDVRSTTCDHGTASPFSPVHQLPICRSPADILLTVPALQRTAMRSVHLVGILHPHHASLRVNLIAVPDFCSPAILSSAHTVPP
jgi:hypothetical protein